MEVDEDEFHAVWPYNEIDMDFLELATRRFSVREFSSRPVDEEKITKILQAAKVAPTAVNYQPQKLYVIKSPEGIRTLAGLRNIFGAPLAVVICYDDTLSWKNGKDNGHDSGEVDASIVTTHMMLQAWELGIGSCWIGSFNPKEVAEAFGIPANEHPVAILPLGYPDEGCRPSDRHAAYRPDDEMVRYK